jgi:hypothetical protein
MPALNPFAHDVLTVIPCLLATETLPLVLEKLVTHTLTEVLGTSGKNVRLQGGKTLET